MVGFFEEAEGVRSMTRLVLFLLTLLAAFVVGVIAAYVLTKSPEATVITALAGVLSAIIAGGIVAIYKRNGSDSNA